MWFVPRYVSADEIGAVLPLTSFATLLSLPVFALAMAVMRETACLAADGDRGRIKSLLRGVFIATAVATAVLVASVWSLVPRFTAAMNVPSLSAGALAAAAALLGCVAFFAANPHLFDPAMRTYIESSAASAGLAPDTLASQMPPTPVLLGATLVLALAIAPFVNMVPAFGEELGWRGMLYPTLAERMSERSAALASGVVWGLWHAPAIAMGHNYGMGYEGFPMAGILTMTLLCGAMSCWLSLLRTRSGSVWPCALAHGAFNAIANVGVVFCSAGQTLFGPSPLGLVAGIPLMAIGVFCWIRLSSAR
jgi:membrane protease YdiL (CAAX protease family)